MADIRGEVTFTALDKQWTMKMGTNAMRQIEAATGKSMGLVLKQLNDDEAATVTLITVVMWGGLRRHHPDLSMDDCDDIIDDLGFEPSGKLRAVKMIEEAFIAAAGVGKKGGDARPRKATAA